MMHRAVALAGTLLFAIAAASTTGAARRPATDRHVTVGVLDKGGKPVTGLTASDFTLQEDGATREILGVSPAAPPSDLALLVDDSAASSDVLAQLRAGLQTFVHGVTAFTPRPWTRVVTLGGRPATAVDFTEEPTALEKGVDRLFPQPGTGAYLLDGIVETATALRARHARTPVIVAFVVERGREFSGADHSRVASVLRSAGASFWPIVLEGASVDLNSIALRERATVTGDVAAQSGGAGRLILSKQGIDGAFADTVTAIGARYDITYARPDALIPPRALGIKVKGPSGVKVVAPTWAGE